ncbi:MAG TPA: alpha/beta hydrolase [Ktedonobacteraceae bacterium]|jgi:pimeloyl-ACP methyl ester carboxylesterase
MNHQMLFIHGAWLTPLCWQPFQRYFEQQGYTCLAPSWPGKDRPLDEQRASPPAELARLGGAEIIAHYAKIIRALPAPPVLVGHSFGGLFVQILLDQGLGKAGVAINPAPPKGVLPTPLAVRASSGVLFTPSFWKRVVHMSLRQFQFGFVNTLPLPVQRAAYAGVVPESGRLFFQVATAALDARSPLAVNFRNAQRAPLLLTAGTLDQTVPLSMIRANYRKYRRSPARTDFLVFERRTHWLIEQEGREEVAASIQDWLLQVL